MLNLTPTSRTITAKPNSARILEVFALATVAELDEGLNWYADANALARTLDADNPERAAGVIAALSPMMNWERNIMLAVRAYDDGQASGALYKNVDKANKILAGEDPRTILGGNKVRNFFEAIADPESTTAVCIDRHAFDIAVGRVTNDQSRATLSRVGTYTAFQDAYRRAAAHLTRTTGVHHTPAAVQAVTWTVWRRLKSAA